MGRHSQLLLPLLPSLLSPTSLLSPQAARRATSCCAPAAKSATEIMPCRESSFHHLIGFQRHASQRHALHRTGLFKKRRCL